MSKTLSKQTLKTFFNYDDFRPGQEDIVNSIYEKNDTLVLMPTGGGKSLCYQVPALMSDGICIVISPLIALMKDQVDTLNSKKIKAIALHSQLSDEEKKEFNAAIESYKFIYISPERLANSYFIKQIRNLKISFIAVDEAHCISQWGHEFRPSYRRISTIRDLFPDKSLIALTATATPDVKQDIIDTLKLKNHNEFVKGFDRSNLTYDVIEVTDKYKAISHLLNEEEGPSIIYASTRKQVEQIHAYLQENTKEKIVHYHGGLPDSERHRTQDLFVSGKVRILISTNAFGMGVDKPDVRLVIHYQLPGDPESYYQEAGRGGRDGKMSRCVLLFKHNDREVHEHFLKHGLPSFPLAQKVMKKTAQAISSDDLMSLNSNESEILKNTIRYLVRNKFLSYSKKDDLFSQTVLSKNYELHLKYYIQGQERKLDAMVDYCATHLCRRNYMLDYFGESHANEACNRCDNCKPEKRSVYNEMNMTITKTILSILRGQDGKYGLFTIVDCLRGESSPTIDKHKLYKNFLYGIYHHMEKKDIINHINMLIQQKLVIRTNSKYPVLKLGIAARKMF